MTKDELIRRLRECEGRGRNENFQKIEPAPAPALPGGRGGNEYFQETEPSLRPPRQRRTAPVTPLDYIRGYGLAPGGDAPSEGGGNNQYFQEIDPAPSIPPPSESRGPSINGGSYRGRKPRPGDAQPREPEPEFLGDDGIIRFNSPAEAEMFYEDIRRRREEMDRRNDELRKEYRQQGLRVWW